MSDLATVEMEFYKEHKGSVRYNCDDPDAALRSAYISKSALPKNNYPSKILVTITARDDA